ncbi:hypothetical protein B296_00048794, partial [Ensete ventricosum]
MYRLYRSLVKPIHTAHTGRYASICRTLLLVKDWHTDPYRCADISSVPVWYQYRAVHT